MTRPVMPRNERATFIRETRAISIPFFGVDQELSNSSDLRGKYTSLTERQYRAFMDSYRGNGATDTKIGFGFRVVGNLLSQIPVAYAEHLDRTGEYDNRRELTQTLLDGFSPIVGAIASLDRNRATAYETWLGLRDGQDPLGSPTAYRFLRWRDKLLFEAKLDNLDKLDEEVAAMDRSGEHKVGPERGCPALKFILPELWGININGCASDPDYFMHDVKVLQNRAVVKATE